MALRTFVTLAAAGLALSLGSAHAEHRSGSDVRFAVSLVGDNLFASLGTDRLYAQPYNHYRPSFGRYHRWYGRSGIRTDVVVTRGGYLKRLYYRRGRIIDTEIIGRVDGRGRWRYFDRGYDDHPRWHARDRDHRYDGRRRYYESRSRYDDRHPDPWVERYDDHYDRNHHDRDDDRRDDRRDRWDDRRDHRDDRYDDRRNDRDHRHDERDDRGRYWRRDSADDGSWRGDETSVRGARVYETDEDGLIIRSKQGVVGRVVYDDGDD